MMAIEQGNLDMVKSLLAWGVNIEAKYEVNWFDQWN